MDSLPTLPVTNLGGGGSPPSLPKRSSSTSQSRGPEGRRTASATSVMDIVESDNALCLCCKSSATMDKYDGRNDMKVLP